MIRIPKKPSNQIINTNYSVDTHFHYIFPSHVSLSNERQVPHTSMLLKLLLIWHLVLQAICMQGSRDM